MLRCNSGGGLRPGGLARMGFFGHDEPRSFDRHFKP